MDDLKATCDLTIDDRFYLLLHKKIMNKTGSARRRAKKYYKDQYRKTGIIPDKVMVMPVRVRNQRNTVGMSRQQFVKSLFFRLILPFG